MKPSSPSNWAHSMIRHALFRAICWISLTSIAISADAQECDMPELAKLIASDAAASDEFGISVAVSGDTALVGAYLDDHAAGTDAGSVYVFVRSDGTWTQQARLTAVDATSGDHFGYAVAVSGNTAVVGAISDDNLNGAFSDEGSAYVFVRSGEVWTQQAKLTASDSASTDYFGVSVAISGETVVVGSYGDSLVNGALTQEGSAYVFIKPNSTWANMTETAKLIASDAAPNDQFGYSVAVSGNTIVVGAYTHDQAIEDTNQGAAYIFVKPQSGWSNKTETAKLSASDAAPNDQFGISVAVSGKTVVVGACLDDNDGGGEAGSAYTFVRPPCGWTDMTETAKLTASDAIAGDNFGASVAVSGGTVVVGANLKNIAGNSWAGSAYVFTRAGGVWTEQTKLIASDGAANDRLGYAVAVSGKTAVVGAFVDSHTGGVNAGAAYIFRAASCDADGDGVPDANDLCPNGAPGQKVDSTGRPLRDCNNDCLVNGADIQCIVDELLSQ